MRKAVMRSRKAVIGGIVAGIAITTAGAAGAGTHWYGITSPPPLSAACKLAQARQNAYVEYEISLGWPNVPAMDGLAVLKHDQALLQAMTQAGCPGTTKVKVLPD